MVKGALTIVWLAVIVVPIVAWRRHRNDPPGYGQPVLQEFPTLRRVRFAAVAIAAALGFIGLLTGGAWRTTGEAAVLGAACVNLIVLFVTDLLA